MTQAGLTHAESWTRETTAYLMLDRFRQALPVTRADGQEVCGLQSRRFDYETLQVVKRNDVHEMPNRTMPKRLRSLAIGSKLLIFAFSPCPALNSLGTCQRLIDFRRHFSWPLLALLVTSERGRHSSQTLPMRSSGVVLLPGRYPQIGG